MTRIPNFAATPFAVGKPPGAPVSRVWSTPEGIDVKSFYGPGDRAGLDLSAD